ncbi:hypothetical protein CMV_015426 [Castanea mollissima]|uniref:Uncharacterized protein n=1 Tax=Castanea mollissima TaxID=60419 RepID=A0A8J4QW71_9ROSI|nr:hypothetical protein CMV_015426 [Castanea mollissima]
MENERQEGRRSKSSSASNVPPPPPTLTIHLLYIVRHCHWNVENHKFTGWSSDQLKEINLESGGNSWSFGRAHPPPPGTPHVLDQHTTKKHSGGKSVMSGASIARIALGVLAAIGVLIALFSRRKSSPSSHFLDEEISSQSRSFTPLASQELSKDLPTDISNDFKGHKSVDSFASIDIKTLQKSPSVGFKLPPPECKKTYNDNEFTNLLNARKITSLRATSYSLVDLQLATANFASGRLLEKASHFIIEELPIIGYEGAIHQVIRD